MIIVSAADERFAAHFAAMLHSAWTHHPTAEFYLLDCGVEPQTRSTLAGYASALEIRLSIITIDAARLDGLPTTFVMSAATYARLLIPDLLPHASRALYIDADAIVVGNLSELWEMDMGHAAIAGVHDRGGRYEPRELGIDLANYVNAGVLLMNLAVWRREHLGAAGLDYVRRHKPDLLDQTAISAVCAGRIRFLSDKWNYTPAGIRRAFRGQPVHIIHFTTQWKPWLYRDVLFGELYLHHRNQTPFAGAAPNAVRRSAVRRAFNLLFGSHKYWRLLISALYARAFVSGYLRQSILQRVYQ